MDGAGATICSSQSPGWSVPQLTGVPLRYLGTGPDGLTAGLRTLTAGLWFAVSERPVAVARAAGECRWEPIVSNM